MKKYNKYEVQTNWEDEISILIDDLHILDDDEFDFLDPFDDINDMKSLSLNKNSVKDENIVLRINSLKRTAEYFDKGYYKLDDEYDDLIKSLEKDLL